MKKEGWNNLPFERTINKVRYPKKIKTTDYLDSGKYPIVSQEDCYVSGYSNELNKVFHIKKPVVIFGDHTRVLKYIDFDFILGADGVKILEPIDTLNTKFFYYFLCAHPIESLGYSRHYKLLKNLTINFPPLPEQQQIVSELDCLQSIIDKKKTQLQELDKLSQSIFYTMFGDPVENEKGWEVKKLKDVAPKKEYKGDIPSYNEKYWLLNLDMVESNTGRIISKVLFDYDDIGSSTNKFNNENVLYSKLRPYLNKVVIPEDSGYSTSELIPLYPQKDILNRYFLASLLRNKSFVDFIKDKVAGAKMPRVNLDTFYKFPLILPPLPLQQEFADKITAIEQQKERIQKSLQDTETLFQSRMDYYFG